MVTNLATNEEPSQANDLAGDLYATVSGAGASVILLHGLFGMGGNLGGLARALAGDFEVHQLDLPNHGRSPWQSNTDLKDLAHSVAAYIDGKGLSPVAVVGHSLGGKVAMQLALDRPDHVAALVVADIAPVAYAASHDAVFAAIAAVETARPESRAEAVSLMGDYVSDPGVAQFLSLSLKRESDGTYTWRFNAAALRANYGKFRAAPEGSVYRGPTLFVYGLDSSYVDEEGRARALELFPQLQFEGIADTGHWLHAEKPREFNGAVLEFLRQSLDLQEHQA